jgi:AcrR family transcriptional regulator
MPVRVAAPPAPRALLDIQRARLLNAAVVVVEELGYQRTTVADITTRARVSRRTFYELFANREECLVAVLDELCERLRYELSRADLQGLPWRERVRSGLWVVLSWLDREPGVARVCVVQSARGGPVVLARREAILERLVGAIDEGRREGARGASCSELTAEGLVGAAQAIVSARLLRGEHRPLAELLGELMGMIVLPYLGPAAARREQTRPLPDPRPLEAQDTPVGVAAGGEGAGDPLAGVRMRLTYRTALVLEGVGLHPGASNRMIADHAGVHDQGQVSKLLARLERLGLLENRGGGHSRGEPNAWTLTARGQRVARGISLTTGQPGSPADARPAHGRRQAA